MIQERRFDISLQVSAPRSSLLRRNILLLFQLLRAPVGSRLVRTDFDGLTLTLGIATTHPAASCPGCGSQSQRVHSRYTRHLAEEPAFGRRVQLQMNVRRFLCYNSGCPRQIFVEPLGGLAAR